MVATAGFAVNPKGVRWPMVRRRLDQLGAWLMPPVCVLCDDAGQRGPIDLCAACQRDLPALPAEAAPAIPGIDAACCPWCYAYPVDELVRALKFHGERCNARLLGTLLALERAGWDAPLPSLVVPVPLHARRLAERGYNQAAELARYAARRLALPLAPRLLERRRDTPKQTRLDSAARAANVAGAFTARVRLAGLHVALVDDVLTTGSTARAAAAALREAGATRIELWAAARAERRDRGGAAHAL
jgi:ComF family protein